MEDTICTIKKYYNDDVEKEWERLEKHFIEFELTKRFLNRYIKPGDKVLDVGGRPGRYSLYLAEKGCDVTLADLSEGTSGSRWKRQRKRVCDLKRFNATPGRLTGIWTDFTTAFS